MARPRRETYDLHRLLREGKISPVCRVVLALIVSSFVLACGPNVSGATSVRVASARIDPDVGLEPRLRHEPAIASLLDDAEHLRLEVLIAAPVAGSSGAELQRLSYRADAEYFYPASAIKLCAAVAALEKLGALRRDAPTSELDAATPLRIQNAMGSFDVLDPTDSETGRISIGQEIRKALVLSDNEAFNRLFDFVGHDELNTRLLDDGFTSARLRHHLGAFGHDARRSPHVELVPAHGEPIVLPERFGTLVLGGNDVPRVLVGVAHLDGYGRRVEAPMTFEDKNRISLRDLQDLLIAVVRPELVPGKAVRLDPDDRALLVDALETVPSESKNPRVIGGAGLDPLHKPLLLAIRAASPGHRIRAFGKGGRSYGFIVQNSYVVDETTGRSVFVAATLYTNANGTMNDDQYEYDEVAMPFVQGLGDFVTHQFLAADAD